MKKNLIFSLLVLLFAECFGQPGKKKDRQNLQFGFKAGATYYSAFNTLSYF